MDEVNTGDLHKELGLGRYIIDLSLGKFIV